MSSSEQDAKQLFPHVVKFLASNDIIVKKLASWFIQQHSDEKELVLLAINTLLKDCSDPNPMTRGLALRTLTSLPDPALLQYSIQPVLSGFQDKSAYVRRNTVTACLKLYHVTPEVIEENGLVDRLYGMIRDQDPIVITNALSVLDVILEKEGGVVINKTMAYYLLNRLSLFTELGLPVVMTHLKKYRPKTDDEALDVMNVVDSYLKHNNSAVVLVALELFLHLVENMPHLKNEVYSRAKGQILHFIKSGNSELSYILLTFIESIIEEQRQLIQPEILAFFCKYNEPLYVKLKKIDILPQLISEETISDVLEELSMYCNDVDHTLSAHSIQSIGMIANCHSNLFDKCVLKLLDLINLGVDYISSNVLCVLQDMDFHNHALLNKVVQCLSSCFDLVADDKGRCALIWLLGEYGAHLADSPYILEDLIDRVEEEISINVQCHLLTASVKLFFHRPAECQEMLGRLFESCSRSQDVNLKDRANFLYQMLKMNPMHARTIICRR